MRLNVILFSFSILLSIALASMASAQQIQVLEPGQGAGWLPGTAQQVRWSADGNYSYFLACYSPSNQCSTECSAQGWIYIRDPGRKEYGHSFTWNIPSSLSGSAAMRVEGYGLQGNLMASGCSQFYIGQGQAPAIHNASTAEKQAQPSKNAEPAEHLFSINLFPISFIMIAVAMVIGGFYYMGRKKQALDTAAEGIETGEQETHAPRRRASERQPSTREKLSALKRSILGNPEGGGSGEGQA